MNATIAICTWNRASLLDKTLTSLSQIRVPPGTSWEVLVVNNNCTDHTDEVISRHESRLPLRGLRETTPGKSHAANRVLREASSDFIVWTDDDVLVGKDWLGHYLDAAKKWPDAAYFGGTIEPLFASPPPHWIRSNLDLLQSTYALKDLGEQIRPMIAHEMVFGANMALRRNRLQGMVFDGRLGPTANIGVNGEETALVRQLIARGETGVWVGPARVEHHIGMERMNITYVRDYFRRYGKLMARTGNREEGKLVSGCPRWVWRKLLEQGLRSVLLSPLRSRGWLIATIEASTASGIIRETLDGKAKTLRAVGRLSGLRDGGC